MLSRPGRSEREMHIRPIERERSDRQAERDDNQEQVFEEDVEIENGKREPRKMADPQLPDAEEVRCHELTHLPYRSWCSHCVRGKGKALEHLKKGERKHGMKELHVDYLFMGGEEDDKLRCIVCAKEPDSKYLLSSVVPLKGASHEFPARRLCAFLRELGMEHHDVMLKSDQEPAILDLLREISKKRLPAKTFLEESPVGASASNGVIERGNQTLAGQIRVLKDALETRLKTKVAGDHNIITWMVEFAAVLVNRYEVGRDGKTPYERLKGKNSKVLGLEFGEKLHFRRSRAGGKLAKLDMAWSDGVFLGFRSQSGEVIVGTEDGVMKTRTVRRKPEEERWHEENLKMVGGVPWRPSPGDDEGSAILPAMYVPEVEFNMREPDVEIRRPDVKEEELMPRRLYIKAKDVENFGATDRCKGCTAIIRGGPRVAHSEACRKRLTEAIAESDEGKERIQAAENRALEYQDRVLEAQMNKGQKNKKAKTETQEARVLEHGCRNLTDQPQVVEDQQVARADKRGLQPEQSEIELKRQRFRQALAEEAGRITRARPSGESELESELKKQRRVAEEAERSTRARASGENELEGELKKQRIGEQAGGATGSSNDREMEEAQEDEVMQVACEDDFEEREVREDEGLEEAWPEGEYRDDRTGELLDPKKVRAAREGELSELEERVYVEADIEECWAKTGKKPIGVRWVDTHKGFGGAPQ